MHLLLAILPLTIVPRIILASTSSIRKQMLSDAGFSFAVLPPDCDEDMLKKQMGDIPLLKKALELAKAKAKSVSAAQPDAYVIGSDQICEYEGRVISKSNNFDESFACLKLLSGATHKQNNGTCIYRNGECIMEHSEIAELTMKNLNDDEIIEYIKLDNPIGCAGSYKFELNGKNLFTKINGKAETIQGFGISAVKRYLSDVKI